MGRARILVTGANGFVGRHVVRRLMKAGHPLTLAMRDSSAFPSSWKDDRLLAVVVTGPLEEAADLDAALEGVSTVVHVAGLAHKTPRSPVEAEKALMRANAEATDRLARAAATAGVRTFVHLSSLAAISGNTAERTIDDEAAAFDPPKTAYGRSKHAAEEALAAASGDMTAISLRPPLIVGGEAKGNWASLQRLAATGLPLPFANVRNRRSLVGVESVAQAVAHLCASEWPSVLSGNYCIADGQPLSLAEIISELRAGMGMSARLFPFPPFLLHKAASRLGKQRQADGLLGSLVVDAARFRREFGFQETKGIKESIRESGVHFRSSRSASGGGETE